MILSDNEIHALANEQGMIQPFESILQRLGPTNVPAISFGISSFGYDLSLSPEDFRVFQRRPGHVVDPKDFRAADLVQAQLQTECTGEQFFVLPAHSYALGVSAERLEMPSDVIGICLGKSTYARCGIIVNATPLEPGWQGHLTIEISNSSDSDCRVYASEGIAQVLFFRGLRPHITYQDRSGKYQHQVEQVTLARV